MSASAPEILASSAVVEADGGSWQHQAISNIYAYLEDSFATNVEDVEIPIIS